MRLSTLNKVSEFFTFKAYCLRFSAELYSRIVASISPVSPCNPQGCEKQTPIYMRPFKVEKQIRTEADAKEAGKTSTEIRDLRRAELEIIKYLFLLPTSPLNLNLGAAMRKKTLLALETSTDAKHLAPVAEHCYHMLKAGSHRNFVEKGVCNGTFETICVATGLGIFLNVAGLVVMFLLAFLDPALHHGNRWKGIGVWPLWFIGGGLVLSGIRGSCFFLLLFSRRQPLDWEKYEEDGESAKERSRLFKTFSRLMIFDRKMKVKDKDLRRLQRKIVMQSVIGGMFIATILVVVSLCLPIWKHL